MNQKKPGSAVLALGGNTFFENMIEQLWLYAEGQAILLAFRSVILREEFAASGGLLLAV